MLYDGLTSSGRGRSSLSQPLSTTDERKSRFYVTEISEPSMFKHIWHVTYDEHEQKFKNLPEVFEQLLDGSNIRSVLAA